MTMKESTVKRPDGCELFIRDWPAPERAATGDGIYLFHGLGEHSGRYQALASWLNERGWRVRAHDHRGHGRSGGARGALNKPDDLLEDSMAMLADFAEDLGAPALLLGHSMGGALAAQTVIARSIPVRGLVLSSPAFDTGMTGGQKVLAKVLNAVAPDLAINNGLNPEFVSRDPETVRAYIADPLVHPKITARLVTWLVQAGRQSLAGAPSLSVGTLLLVAGADRLVRPEGSRQFSERAPKSHLTVHWYDGFFHELFNEPPAERAKVLADLDTWLTQLARR
jgi:alpha-beta hydrolase superfamily lysophospholipase